MGCGASSVVVPTQEEASAHPSHGVPTGPSRAHRPSESSTLVPSIQPLNKTRAIAPDQDRLDPGATARSAAADATSCVLDGTAQVSPPAPPRILASKLIESHQVLHDTGAAAMHKRLPPLPGAIVATASDPGHVHPSSLLRKSRLAPIAPASPPQPMYEPLQQPMQQQQQHYQVLEVQPVQPSTSESLDPGPQYAPPTPELSNLTPRQSVTPPPFSARQHVASDTRAAPPNAKAAIEAALSMSLAPTAIQSGASKSPQRSVTSKPVISEALEHAEAEPHQARGSPTKAHVRFAGPGPGAAASEQQGFQKPPPLVIGGNTSLQGGLSKSPASAVTPVDQAISVLQQQQRAVPPESASLCFDPQLLHDLEVEPGERESTGDRESFNDQYTPKSPFESSIFQREGGVSRQTSMTESRDGRSSQHSSNHDKDDEDEDELDEDLRASGLSVSGMHIAGATGNDLVARALKRNIRRLTFDGTAKDNTNTSMARVNPVRSSRSVSHCAVSLAFLLEFSQRVPADMTTLEVVYKVIVPETRNIRCRYADYIDAEHTSLPHYFVSHRWAAPFRTLVSALFLHFDCNNVDSDSLDPTNTFLWIDVFAVNQHPGAEQVGDLADLQDALSAADHGTLLCLDEKGLVLTRIWCLYEIHHTIRLKGTHGLRVLAADVKYTELRDIFNSLDASRAQATVEEDRHRILADIQATTGIDTLNRGIKEALVESCLLEAQSLQTSRGSKTSMFVAAHYKAGQMLRVAGKYAEAEAYMRQIMTVYEEGLGVQDKQCAACLVSLGTLQQEQGRYADAEQLCRAGLQLTESLLKEAVTRYRAGGEEVPGLDVTVADVMYAYTALGSVLQAQGRFSEALPYFEKALATCKEVMGRAHPDTATAMQALAGLLQAVGRSKDALKLLKKAVVLREEHLGQDHPLTAVTYDALGVVLQQRGAFGEAEPLFMKALDVRRQRLGDDHPAVGVSMHNLGSLMADQGRMEEAEASYLAALSVREAALGLGHPASAATLNNLAALYKESGRVDEAVPLLQHALEARTQALGPEHPATSSCMNNLATLLLERGHLEDAQPLYLEHVRVLEKVLGPDHAEVAMALENYATCLKAAGQVDEACAIFKRALKILKAAVGDAHPDVAHCAANLALLLQEQNDLEEAGRLFSSALSIRTKVYGSKHKGNIHLLRALGAIAAKEGDLSKAEEVYHSAISLCRQLNTEHGSRPQSAITTKRASDHLFNLSRKASLATSNPDAPMSGPQHSSSTSIALLSRLSTRSQGVGQTDVLAQLATNLNELGNVLLDAGKLDGAQEAFREALELRDTLFGDDHVDTAMVKENLACLLLETGQHQEAEQLFKDALDCNLLLPAGSRGPAALTAYNLGRALEAQGKSRHEEARQAYQQGVQIAEAALGADHADTLQYKDNLAAFVKMQAAASKPKSGRRRRKAPADDQAGDDEVDAG